MDFAGPFNVFIFLVIVDVLSKWLFPMKSTTSKRIIEVLRRLFNTIGLPQQIIFDHVPQFTPDKRFTKSNGIKHIKSSPYRLFTNREAKMFVQMLKKTLIQGVMSLQELAIM